jgi:hypothetical protein
MAHTGFDIIGPTGDVLLADRNWTYGLTSDTVEDPEEFIERSMLSSCRVCPSTALIRRAAIPVGGMTERDSPAIDFGLWLRMASSGWQVAFIADTLGAYRIHDASHSSAFAQPNGPGYVNADKLIMTNHEVKLRFIADHVDDPLQCRRLHRLARRGNRTALISRARALTLPTRRPGPTFRAMSGAVRLAPDLLLDARSYRLVAASLLGPNIVSRLRPKPAAAFSQADRADKNRHAWTDSR